MSKNLAENNKSIGLILIGLVFLIFGLVGFTGSIYSYQRDIKIENSGIKVQAQVIKKYKSYATDEGTEYSVSCFFVTPDNKRFESRKILSKAVWNMTKPGDEISIIYSKDDPKHNFLEGSGFTSLALLIFFCMLTGFFFFSGLIILMSIWLNRREEIKILDI